MNEAILHHYPMSPFAEKARLMLGYKRLPWCSVIIPPVMPKPDVVSLTGGYRKTPILQIGADVYCDTALIARVLEARQPTPTLYPLGAPLARQCSVYDDDQGRGRLGSAEIDDLVTVDLVTVDDSAIEPSTN